jgi:hypothetical protein
LHRRRRRKLTTPPIDRRTSTKPTIITTGVRSSNPQNQTSKNQNLQIHTEIGAGEEERKTNGEPPPVTVLDTVVRREDRLLVAPPPPPYLHDEKEDLDLREKM